MLTRWRWRTSFWILGGLGLLWALFWLLWFRDYTERRPAADQVTSQSGIGFRDVVRSMPMSLAMVQYFASNFTFFIGLSWMLPYLKRQFHLADGEAAAFAMAPLLAGTLSQWMAGWLVDVLYRSRYRAWSRRVPAILGFAISTAGLFALTRAGTPS